MTEHRPIDISIAIRWRLAASVGALTRKVVMQRDLSTPADAVPARIQVHFHRADDRVLHTLSEEHGYSDGDKTFLATCLTRGDELHVGTCGGDIVFSGWVASGRFDLDSGDWIDLPRSSGYSYKIFTPAKYRRLGISRAYHHYLGENMRARGHERLLSWVDDGNTASIQAHVRAGFSELTSYRELRIRTWVKRFFFAKHFHARMRLLSPPDILT